MIRKQYERNRIARRFVLSHPAYDISYAFEMATEFLESRKTAPPMPTRALAGIRDRLALDILMIAGDVRSVGLAFARATEFVQLSQKAYGK